MTGALDLALERDKAALVELLKRAGANEPSEDPQYFWGFSSGQGMPPLDRVGPGGYCPVTPGVPDRRKPD